jgi:predicted pyridoxine 5'-phosphate oxidase superfamily flavin-nucleotide-binding protein
VGKVVERITPELRAWIERQHVFFVATAPTEPDGHVNLSPKGYDTLRILGDRTLAYLDLTGSGAETIAHLRQNGRITLLFCAFDGPPRIARIHGRGEVLRPGDDGFDELAAAFPSLPGARAVIRVTCERLSTSCGYAVPLYDYVGERDTLVEWAERRGPDGVERYWAERNAESIDGLPAVSPAGS